MQKVKTTNQWTVPDLKGDISQMTGKTPRIVSSVNAQGRQGQQQARQQALPKAGTPEALYKIYLSFRI
ncbi:MAG: hypothetical protein ACYCX2_02355 [Christensenellales bacterium]